MKPEKKKLIYFSPRSTLSFDMGVYWSALNAHAFSLSAVSFPYAAAFLLKGILKIILSFLFLKGPELCSLR